MSQSAEITNRKAFVWMAMVRSRAVCFSCGLKPHRGRGLEFWTRDARDPQPILLMMAWAGTDVEKIKTQREECDVLCPKCATKKGAKLFTNKKPNLKHYGMLP